MTHIELPQLRPLARQGEAYKKELKAILRAEGRQIREDAQKIAQSGKLTPRNLIQLALKHKLNVKAVCEYLEKEGVLPTGTYKSLNERGFRPSVLLREEWVKVQAEQLPEWKKKLAEVSDA